MKLPVSLGYVVVVMLLAGAAAVLSYTMPHPAFNLSALLIGIYALHLVSLRVMVREYAGRARLIGKLGNDGPWENMDVRQIRDGLEKERRELDNRKAELERKIEAAEEQYNLLRQMIRDRVGNGPQAPATASAPAQVPVTAAVSDSRAPSAGGQRVTTTDFPPRIHGRW